MTYDAETTGSDGARPHGTRRHKIAYLVSRFPHLPETFILREIDRIEAEGHEVVLCPLLRNRDEVVHPAAEPWVDRAVYTPFISPRMLLDVVLAFARRPRAAARALLGPLLRVIRSPNFLIGTLGIVAKAAHLARILEERGVDHVHAHFATHPAMAAYMVHQLTGIPYSFTVHAHDLYVDTVMLDRKIREAAFVVTISDYNRELLDSYGQATPVHVVRSGVDLERYPVQDEPPPEPFTLLAVGSLQPYKGFPYLVEALGILSRRDQLDGIRVRIVGGGPDRDRLVRRLRELGIEGHVELLGPRSEDEVARYLQQAHAFVLPSIVTPSGKMEGLPVVLIEALAVGLPTISTEISGIPELVRPGETGQLVPPEDPERLASAIRWVVDHPDEARERARKGRELVEREHRLDTNVARLAGLFEGRSTT